MRRETKVKNILSSLYDMSQLVRKKSPGIDKDLERARIMIQRVFNFNLLTIFQYDYLERHLVGVHHYGEPSNLVDAVNFRIGKGATGWCLQHKRTLLINNISRKKAGSRFFINSFLSVPIIVNENIMGVATMGSFEKGGYDETDRFLFEMFSPYLGSLLVKSYFNFHKEAAA